MSSLTPSYRVCCVLRSLWILSGEIWISFIRDSNSSALDRSQRCPVQRPNGPSEDQTAEVIPVPDFLHRFFFKVSALLNGTFSSTTFPFLSLIDLLSIYYKLYHFIFYWLLAPLRMDKVHFRSIWVHRKLIIWHKCDIYRDNHATNHDKEPL